MYDLEKIMEDYVRHSSVLGGKHDVPMVFRYAEAVYKNIKAKGISAGRLLDYEMDSIPAATDKRAADFKNDQNTEYEITVPIWDVYPNDLDPIFDEIRFQRHLISDEDIDFKRRTTWLYPIDGNDDFPKTFFR